MQKQIIQFYSACIIQQVYVCKRYQQILHAVQSLNNFTNRYVTGQHIWTLSTLHVINSGGDS
jgi:hypothetical protein